MSPPSPPSGDTLAHEPPGYLALLRGNPDFRNLWFGQIVSQLGDWFDTVAVFTLVLALTGSAIAAGLLTLARFLPSVFVGPMAGVVIDRIDRRKLLITTDLLRAIVVLGFLAAKRYELVWLIYGVTIVQFSISSLFEPARTALLPTITGPHELVAANALGAVTWSTMLTLGAAVGGAVTHYLGVDAAFVIDSITFLGSALFLSRIRRPGPKPAAHPRAFSWGHATGWHDMRDGIAYLRRERAVRLLLFVKPAWCLSSGGLVLLLTLLGDRVFRIGHDASAGISILYTARGVGTAIGPILTRRIAGQDPVKMRRALGPALLVAGAFYLLLSVAPTIEWAAAAALCAHMGGSVLWVFSTVLLQMAVPNALRGRVFSLELMAMTLTMSLSTYFTSVAADQWKIGLRPLIAVLACVAFGSVLLWEGLERRARTKA